MIREGAAPRWPIITALAGVALIVGSFLPWTVLTGTFGAHASVAGTDCSGRGWISVALGAVLIVAGGLSLPEPHRLGTAAADIGSLGATALTVYEFLRLTSDSGVLKASNSSGIWDVTAGAGLLIVTVAAVISLVGAAGMTGRHARHVSSGTSGSSPLGDPVR